MKQVKPCPHCKSKQGWWEHKILYFQQFYDESGDPTHASDRSGRTGKNKYCFDCNTDITDCISPEDTK